MLISKFYKIASHSKDPGPDPLSNCIHDEPNSAMTQFPLAFGSNPNRQYPQINGHDLMLPRERASRLLCPNLSLSLYKFDNLTTLNLQQLNRKPSRVFFSIPMRFTRDFSIAVLFPSLSLISISTPFFF